MPPQDANPTPSFGGFGLNAPSTPIGHPQVHLDGEIWATVLYDLRQSMITADPQNGRDDFEQLLTTALALTPSRPSMLDARDAVLQAALALGLDTGAQCQTWGVFAV